VMIAGVLGGVFIAHTLYQIVLSYGASGLEVRFSYAFMSPDPVSPVSPPFSLKSMLALVLFMVLRVGVVAAASQVSAESQERLVNPKRAEQAWRGWI